MVLVQTPTIWHHIFLTFLPSFVKKNLNAHSIDTLFKKQEILVESVVKIVDAN